MRLYWFPFIWPPAITTLSQGFSLRVLNKMSIAERSSAKYKTKKLEIIKKPFAKTRKTLKLRSFFGWIYCFIARCSAFFSFSCCALCCICCILPFREWVAYSGQVCEALLRQPAEEVERCSRWDHIVPHLNSRGEREITLRIFISLSCAGFALLPSRRNKRDFYAFIMLLSFFLLLLELYIYERCVMMHFWVLSATCIHVVVAPYISDSDSTWEKVLLRARTRYRLRYDFRWTWCEFSASFDCSRV